MHGKDMLVEFVDALDGGELAVHADHCSGRGGAEHNGVVIVSVQLEDWVPVDYQLFVGGVGFV